MSFDRTTFAAVIAIAVAGVACTNEPVGGEAPTVDDDGLVPADEAASYNGWSHEYWGSFQLCNGSGYAEAQWTRSYGDSTRGGGMCAVIKGSESCSSDVSCTATARAAYGSSAFGYCYAGACSYRPGGPASFCTQSSSRSPGWFYVPLYELGGGSRTYADGIVGCMTKTAGPNTACGGTNGSLYIRSFGDTSWSYGDGCF